MSRHRVEEARRIVNPYLGGEAYFTTQDLAGESVKPARFRELFVPFRELFAPEMRSRASFVCIFWGVPGGALLRDLHLRAAGLLVPAHLR